MIYRVTTCMALFWAVAIIFSDRAGAVNNPPDNGMQSKNERMLMASMGEKPASEANGTIILIGASYAAGLKVEKIAGRKLVNKGIGGEQSFESLARFDGEVIAEKPNAVILWGFINDIFRSDRQQVDSAIDRIKASYIAMIGKAEENGIIPIVATEVTMSMRPGFKAWAESLIPRLRGKSSYQEYVNGHVLQVNQWLKEYAREKGILVLDLQALLAEGGAMRNKAYSQQDGSHISEKGYSRIRDYILANTTL